ncbi:MAG: class D sortase [Chloroflexi bacterium]|nr:class D sortase [Chloroflexota bacterium]
MSDRKKAVGDYSVEELNELLYRKKRSIRRQRLQRLKSSGRLVDIDGLPAPHASTGTVKHQTMKNNGSVPEAMIVASSPSLTHRVANKFLLLVEIAAIIGLVVILFNLWIAQRGLNQELAQVQRNEASELSLPTPEPTPIIDLVVLPTGHRYIDGRSPEPIESGDIPAHLLPALQAYKPPPIPTPSPEQARLIKIPAIDVNHPIVEGAYDWEQLKHGVAHYIDSAQPGQNGNVVLAAHNDVYGAIFRHLDQLAPGDEFIIQTDQREYTYIITKIDVVEPTETQVMDTTDHASATLISCYPYRINTQRIVVFADLVTDQSG